MPTTVVCCLNLSYDIRRYLPLPTNSIPHDLSVPMNANPKQHPEVLLGVPDAFSRSVLMARSRTIKKPSPSAMVNVAFPINICRCINRGAIHKVLVPRGEVWPGLKPWKVCEVPNRCDVATGNWGKGLGSRHVHQGRCSTCIPVAILHRSHSHDRQAGAYLSRKLSSDVAGQNLRRTNFLRLGRIGIRIHFSQFQNQNVVNVRLDKERRDEVSKETLENRFNLFKKVKEDFRFLNSDAYNMDEKDYILGVSEISRVLIPPKSSFPVSWYGAQNHMAITGYP
ncbi:uncharacterized protein BDR25DRAFT_363557 [Lindgomyces ingoldianus]|uniref:Uncharacterized protein n=1 Tax=Lindgomyces ingoldianus TaxID=673940 RepID=A0ACB6Q7H9_9PLEO|nr:uncharacterized protein BDR25DRAFT_363557 [Lindgomyces ingoldianus]KAF2462813.1 hypothetical protein BDR25DRAFT_363557 [Lindgomyces ingoldianus]